MPLIYSSGLLLFGSSSELVCVAITVGVAKGVAVGIVIAVGFFIATTSRSMVRRIYRCDAIHSHRSRPASDMEQLDKNGNKVVVLVLEGIVFFGTADHLLDQIERLLREDVSHLILDMKRITYIDSTGAGTIAQIAKLVLLILIERCVF